MRSMYQNETVPHSRRRFIRHEQRSALCIVPRQYLGIALRAGAARLALAPIFAIITSA